MSNHTATAAPAYIARDTYTGRYTTNNLRPGYSVSSFTAAELAAFATEGVLWESFGTPRGSRREHFARTRYVADSDGNLHCYSADGHKVIVHPADRVLRIVAKVA